VSLFLRNGNTFKVTSREAMDLVDELPAGNYVVKQDSFKNFFLESIDSFEIPAKLYGQTLRHTARILHTFLDRDASTGVMLTGEKGSGKTLLAKNIAVQAATQGIPTIVINAAWCGDQFNSFIQAIEQPMVVLFDEFEKVYDKDDQERILTLLDGVFPSRKLFMLTCNDKWRVDVHMRNRPGRIFYMLDFKGLDEQFIREYCEDNLLNQQYIDQICKVSAMFDQFNFDMLKALVEDMNRFNETPQQCLEMLNAKPEFAGKSSFKVKLYVGDQMIGENELEDTVWEGNPMQNGMGIGYYVVLDPESQDEDDNRQYQVQTFNAGDIKNIDSRGEKFTMINSEGARAVLTKVRPRTYSYNWDAY
jgi:hypothetical protein